MWPEQEHPSGLNADECARQWVAEHNEGLVKQFPFNNS